MAVAGTVQRWLTAVAAHGRDTRAAGVLAGVPRLVAALMQRLSAAVGGMPLDVEISYEADDAVRAPLIPYPNPNPATSTLPSCPASNAPASWRSAPTPGRPVCAQEPFAAGDAELDITVDSELLPLLPPGFLEGQLAALGGQPRARAARAAPADGAGAADACGEAAGLARWLCERRGALLWALAAEVGALAGMLVAYLAFARARRAQGAQVLRRPSLEGGC